MPLFTEQPATPCYVLFDVIKREGHLNHAQLAAIVLSSKALPDGRSAVAHALDRSWLFRFVVRAPVDSVQERLFADYGSSGVRLVMRLRSRRGGAALSSEEIFEMVTGTGARSMESALAAAGEDPRPYRNLLDRLAANRTYTIAEKAELGLVLFVAAGCSASVSRSVRYLLGYERKVFGSTSPTPISSALSQEPVAREEGDCLLCLGLVRLREGYVAGRPHWVDPLGPGCVIGSLAAEKGGVCDVEKDVSSRHLRVWHADGCWWVCDLGSANGSWLRTAGEDKEQSLAPEIKREVGPGDELRLGSATIFVLVEGLPE